MDPEDLNRMLRSAGVDLWDLIETAIDVAARDHAGEFRLRRDAIVGRLYAAERCRNCEPDRALGEKVEMAKPRVGAEDKGSSSSESMNREEEEDDEEEEEEIESEQRKILAIKDFIEDPDQPEDSLISLLQNLADMDITIKAIKETDIGKQVNLLRKNPSGEVRRLAKQLLRKWKDLVDEWVKSNSASDAAASPAIITDGDSPQQIPRRDHNNGHHVQEFAYSPNPHKSGVISERNGPELVKPGPRREGPIAKPIPRSTPSYAATSKAKEKEQKDNLLDAERLASARKRLHENYQEAQNAKKQRTIQVMDIHEIPKPKNGFVRKSGVQAKHW